MPLAPSFSYPHPPHGTAGSGVDYIHPAPPVLADGLHYYPPAPYPCTYNPHYVSHAPPYSCPYPDPRLPCYSHHGTALHPSTPHVQYPQYHYCRGAPYYPLTPDGVPPFLPAAPEIDFRQDSHSTRHPAQASHGPTCFSEFRSPQFFYPQMFRMPFKWSPHEPDEPAALGDGDASAEAETGAGHSYVPSHSDLVPCNDKVQEARPINSFDGAHRWRGFPVMWRGGAPFALVPLSNIDGEQNLFVPKSIPVRFTPEQLQKNVKADGDWPLSHGSVLPVIGKQGSIPAAIQENDKGKPNVKDSVNDEASSSGPIVVMPATKEAGRESSNSLPYVLMPGAKEAGRESGTPMPYVLIPAAREGGQDSGTLLSSALRPADKDVGHGSSKCPTNVSTDFREEQEKLRKLEKQKASTVHAEVPVKVIPVVQLPSNVSPMQKEDVSQKDQASKGLSNTEAAVTGNGVQKKVAVDDVQVKPHTMKYDGKNAKAATASDAQQAKRDSMHSKSYMHKDSPIQKKSFPAIKLVLPSDPKRCKSPLKSTVAQKKSVGQESADTPLVESSAPIKAPKDGKDVGHKPDFSVSVDGDISDKAVLPSDKRQRTSDVKVMPGPSHRDEIQKSTEIKVVSTAVPKDAEEKFATGTKVVPDASVRVDSLCHDKKDQDSSANELDKIPRKVMSQESAVVRIQAVYRGCCVRRTKPLTQLQVIKEVEAKMHDLLKEVDSKSETLKEPMKWWRFLSESIMALLLKLDTVQEHLSYVRERRKSVTRDLSRALETLDGKLSSTEQPYAVPDGERESSSDSSKNLEMINGERESSSDSSKNLEMINDEIADSASHSESNATAHCTGIVESEQLALSESLDAMSVSCNGPPTMRKEIAAGFEVGESDHQIVLDVEGNDGGLKVGNEASVFAFHPCKQVIEQEVDPDHEEDKEIIEDVGQQGVLETSPESAQIQEGGMAGSEYVEITEDGDQQGVLGISPDAAQRQERVMTGSESAAVSDVNAGARVLGLSKDAEHAEPDGFVPSPTEVSLREGTEERAQLENDDKLGEKPEAMIKVLEEFKEDDAAATANSSTEMIGGEKIGEQVEQEFVEFERANDSAALVQSQHFDSLPGRESIKKVEVVQFSAEVATECHTNLSGLGHESSESLSVEQLQQPEGGVMNVGLQPGSNDTCNTTELLVGESRLESAKSRVESSDVEMGANVEGDYVAGQQILQGHSHEEAVVDEIHDNELDVTVMGKHELVDIPMEGEESVLSLDRDDTEAAGDDLRQLTCDLVDVSYSHGDMNAEPLASAGLVTGEELGVKAGTLIVENSGCSAKPLSLNGFEVPDSQNLSITDSVSVLTTISSVKEEPDHISRSVQNVEGNSNERISCIQEPVAVTTGQEIEDGISKHKMIDVGVTLEEGQHFVELSDECLPSKPAEDGAGSKMDSVGLCTCRTNVDVQQSDEPELCESFKGEDHGIYNVDNGNFNANVEREQCLLPKDNLPEEIAAGDINYEAGEQQDLSLGWNVLVEDSNTSDGSQEQLCAKAREMDMQKHRVQNVAAESKSLLTLVEKLAEWNQQAASMITQLSERMDRLEKASHSKRTVKSRKGGKSIRRRITSGIQ